MWYNLKYLQINVFIEIYSFISDWNSFIVNAEKFKIGVLINMLLTV